RSVASGTVTAVCTPLHVGGSLATFLVEITDEHGRRVCTARLTCAYLERRPGRPEPPSDGPLGAGALDDGSQWTTGATALSGRRDRRGTGRRRQTRWRRALIRASARWGGRPRRIRRPAPGRIRPSAIASGSPSERRSIATDASRWVTTGTNPSRAKNRFA